MNLNSKRRVRNVKVTQLSDINVFTEVCRVKTCIYETYLFKKKRAYKISIDHVDIDI